MDGKNEQHEGRGKGGGEDPDDRRIRQAEDEAEKILGTGRDADVRSVAPSDGTGVSGTVPTSPSGG